ncbi:hypothetical protein AB0O01_11905 [Streptomyces sp. NPDC093252]|uniref:hypothetical protein n=1 Tax=Streptomyces sp. NPDC093252 TaxID=3154980 RepID=UPI00343C668C
MTITTPGPGDPEENLSWKIITVTPKIADNLLSQGSVNRNLDMGQVRSLASAIRRKEWRLTHQGIAFDEDGLLLDGQHRLRAIIEADTPVKMFVVNGLPRSVFPVLDTGKRRSAADALLSTEAKYRHLLSSTIRHVILFKDMPNERWSGSRAHVSNDLILAAYNDDKSRYEEAVTIGRELSKHLFASPTAVAAGYFLTTEVAPALNVDEWVSGLKSGANLDPSDARLALREIPMDTQKRGSKRRMGMRDQVAIYINAWNAWGEPETVGKLRLRRLRKGEKMPVPIKARFPHKKFTGESS